MAQRAANLMAMELVETPHASLIARVRWTQSKTRCTHLLRISTSRPLAQVKKSLAGNKKHTTSHENFKPLPLPVSRTVFSLSSVAGGETYAHHTSSGGARLKEKNHVHQDIKNTGQKEKSKFDGLRPPQDSPMRTSTGGR